MEEKFICQYCGKECKANYALTYHQNRCNSNPNRIYNKSTYTKHHKVTCKYCSEEFDVAVIARHEKACSDPNSKLNKKRQKIKYIYNEDLTCKYCGKVYKTVGNLVQHETKVCKLNPNITEEDRENRRIKYQNDYQNKSEESKIKMAWSKGLTKETNSSVLQQSINQSKFYKDNPDKIKSYHFKFGWYKNFQCDSSWELAFLVYCLDNGINIKRNKKAFKYISIDSLEHNYFPDFVIGDIYYEIKGKYYEDDFLKIQQFPENLVLIDGTNINKYLNYVINKYGDNFTEVLYDSDMPNYMNQPNKLNKKIDDLIID